MREPFYELDDADPCKSLRQNKTPYFQCVLPEGHDGNHAYYKQSYKGIEKVAEWN